MATSRAQPKHARSCQPEAEADGHARSGLTSETARGSAVLSCLIRALAAQAAREAFAAALSQRDFATPMSDTGEGRRR